jgi:uncharacterized protein YhaN
LSAEGKPSQIGQLRSERERLDDEISRLSAEGREYARLVSDRDRLGDAIKALESDANECQHRLDWLERASSARDQWLRRVDVAAELKSLEGTPLLRSGAVDEFDAVEARIAALRKKLADVKKDRASVRRDAEKLSVREALVRQGPRIEALAEQQGWLKSLTSEHAQLGTEIEQSLKGLADLHRELGLPPPVDGKLPFDLAALDRLKPVQKQLRIAQKNLIQAKRAAQKAGATLEGEGAEVTKSLEARGDRDVNGALERAGTLVSRLRRRVQLDEKIAEMSRQQSELAGQGDELLDHQFLPARVLGVLGSVFVLGVSMGLGGMLLPKTFLGSAGWLMAVVGLVSTGTAAAAKLWLERNAADDLDNNHDQAATLNRQLADAKSERDTLDAQLPRGGGPLLARLAAAEKEQAEIEAMLPIEARRRAADKEVAASRKTYKTARDEYEAARKRWRKALEATGLPGNLSTKQLAHFAQRRDTLEDLSRSLARSRHDQAERKQALDSLHQRIVQLAADAQFERGTDDPPALLARLHETWLRQQQLVDQRSALAKKDKQLGRYGMKLLRAISARRQRRAALLDHAGAKDEAQFRRTAVQGARLEWLRNEHDALSKDLLRMLGGDDDREFDRYLSQHLAQETEREQYDLIERRDLLRQQLKEAAEQRGQIVERVRTMGDDHRLADRLLDRSAIDVQLREAVERWQVLAVTHRVLASVRKDYESNRQPEVLLEASRYLASMTDGRYRRIWTPLDEDVLRVDDDRSQPLAVELLSRGTREQVFLSLRLALVSAYARSGARLPMVLDDVLVNFDAKRATAAAHLLRDFAEQGRQLIVFTCHEHMAHLFHTMGVAVIRLPDNTEADVRVSPIKLLRVERPEVVAVVAPVPPPPPAPEPIPPPPPPVPVAAPIVIQPLVAEIAPETMPMPEPEPVTEPAPPRRTRKRIRVEKHSPQVHLHRRRGLFHTSVWHENRDEPADESPS